MSYINKMSTPITKESNFNEWYRKILFDGSFIQYYDVSGCYVLLPNSYSIWQNLQKHIDEMLSERNVKNVYFPLLITKKNLFKEQSHIEGFSPEVAWVTKTGDTLIPEDDELAIRPTSECAMYGTFSNLIKSHNDMPLKFNQWCNVLRWEFKDPIPFIRSREFLWQEGHTCYSNISDALHEIHDIIRLYRDVYTNLLCIPTIIGRKTENEKFSGALTTFTTETYIPVIGKAIQASTAHCLGDNFSKMFNIVFQDSYETKRFAIQNSWGFTTRSIGIMLMTHGDNKGAIIPPLVAPIQVIIIPIYNNSNKGYVCDNIKKIVLSTIHNMNIRYHIDFRESHTPGWKYNHYEQQGVPIRMEIGPKDITNNTVVFCRRDTGQKIICGNDNIPKMITSLIQNMHVDMYQKARQAVYSNITTPSNKEEFISATNDNKLCIIKWCNDSDCEKEIKNITGAKSLCIPFDEERFNVIDIQQCIFCSKDNRIECLFGKSY